MSTAATRRILSTAKRWPRSGWKGCRAGKAKVAGLIHCTYLKAREWVANQVHSLDVLSARVGSSRDAERQRLSSIKGATPTPLGWLYESETAACPPANRQGPKAEGHQPCIVAPRITSRVPSPLAAYRMPACHGERTDCLPVLPPASTYARCDHRRRRNTHPIRAS